VKIRGRVEKRDLEGGLFQLVADDGKRWTLLGAARDLERAAGAHVEVEGSADEGGGFGIGMAGPQLRVSSVKKL
jgi:hypothetical protein